MDSDSTSPATAGAALSEARMRTAQVRRADLQLCWMLLIVVAAYVSIGSVMSVPPHAGASWAPAAIVLMLIAFIASAVVVGVRIRAYSRAAITIYFGTIIGFNVWNALVISTSIVTRFWAANQPTYHFGVSEGIATIPLLIGAWLIWKRSRILARSL